MNVRSSIQSLLRGPVSKLADKYASRPDRTLVHRSLTELYQKILNQPGKNGLVIKFDHNEKFIIFSDQHKGAKDGSDDFSYSENNYLAALSYYNELGYHFINLGDSEELWENNILAVKKHHAASFEAEKLFLQRRAFTKIFGNHDLYWDNDPLAPIMLQTIFGEPVKVYEGLILQTQVDGQQMNLFFTHGHQGDKQSDGNWFSKWFISNIWAPLQMYLELNLNTPAHDNLLKTAHNQYMYEWVAPKNNLVLITGHTHQPVFLSLTYLERLFGRLSKAQKKNDLQEIENIRAEIHLRKIKEDSIIADFTATEPTYFNTGCCCFNDGDITGLEIENGFLTLVKWEYNEGRHPKRIVLEQVRLKDLIKSI